MLFTHLLLIKTSPYFIYCSSEVDAIDTCKRFKREDIIGVVQAEGGLIVLEPKQTIVLHPIEQKQIELDPTKAEPFFDGVEKEIEQIVKEIEDEQAPE